MERVEPAPIELTSSGDLIVPVHPPESREAIRLADYDRPVDGERVVWLQPRGWIFDLRAVGEPRLAEGGRTVIAIADEAEWYLAQSEGREPRVRAVVTVRAVFVERPRPV